MSRSQIVCLDLFAKSHFLCIYYIMVFLHISPSRERAFPRTQLCPTFNSSLWEFSRGSCVCVIEVGDELSWPFGCHVWKISSCSKSILISLAMTSQWPNILTIADLLTTDHLRWGASPIFLLQRTKRCEFRRPILDSRNRSTSDGTCCTRRQTPRNPTQKGIIACISNHPDTLWINFQDLQMKKMNYNKWQASWCSLSPALSSWSLSLVIIHLLHLKILEINS